MPVPFPSRGNAVGWLDRHFRGARSMGAWFRREIGGRRWEVPKRYRDFSPLATDSTRRRPSPAVARRALLDVAQNGPRRNGQMNRKTRQSQVLCNFFVGRADHLSEALDLRDRLRRRQCKCIGSIGSLAAAGVRRFSGEVVSRGVGVSSHGFSGAD
jgi:hypothetical protein